MTQIFEFDGLTGQGGMVVASAEKLSEIQAYQTDASRVTAEMVEAEARRRLDAGFTFTFADIRGTHFFKTSPDHMKGWDEVTALKDALIQSGLPSGEIAIKTSTGAISVTASEWNSILLFSAFNHRQPIWQASFALKAMDPIPSDYADPAFWP